MRRKMTDLLERWRADPDRKGLVITGARQIGKTYTISEFGMDRYDHFVRLDLSEGEAVRGIFRDSINADDVIGRICLRHPGFEAERGRSLVFLDEIQACPDARAAIKPLVHDGRVDVIASGSLLGTMGLKRADDEGIFWNRDMWVNIGVGEFTESSVGERVLREEDPERAIRAATSQGSRYLIPVGYEQHVRMYPMDFEEYLWAIGIPETTTAAIRGHVRDREPFDCDTLEVLERYYLQYILVGGMPEAVKTSLTGDYGKVLNVQRGICDGYFADVLRYAPAGMSAAVAGAMSSIPKAIRRRNRRFRFTDIEGRENVGWREYADPLSWLDSSGMVSVCSNLTEPARPLRSNVGRDFKIYMGDTGLLMAMMGDDRAALLDGGRAINAGGIAENATANMLERCGIDLYYFERDRKVMEGEREVRDRIEVDFIASLGLDLAAIEVKSGSNRSSRSLRKMMTDPRYTIYEVDRLIRFGPGNILVDGDGVEHYPLFAAAFADSLRNDPEVELLGARDLVLRSPVVPAGHLVGDSLNATASPSVGSASSKAVSSARGRKHGPNRGYPSMPFSSVYTFPSEILMALLTVRLLWKSVRRDLARLFLPDLTSMAVTSPSMLMTKSTLRVLSSLL